MSSSKYLKTVLKYSDWVKVLSYISSLWTCVCVCVSPLLSYSSPRPPLLFRLQFTATQKMSSSGCPPSLHSITLLQVMCYQEHSHNIAHKTARSPHIDAAADLLQPLWRTSGVCAFNLNTHGHCLWKMDLVSIRAVDKGRTLHYLHFVWLRQTSLNPYFITLFDFDCKICTSWASSFLKSNAGRQNDKSDSRMITSERKGDLKEKCRVTHQGNSRFWSQGPRLLNLSQSHVNEPGEGSSGGEDTLMEMGAVNWNRVR